MTPIIRPMLEQDLDIVTDIEKQVTFDVPWSRRIFEDCLKIGYSCWVIERPLDGVLGFGLLSTVLDEGHLLNLCIKQGFQKQGLGTALLAHLLALCRERSVSYLYLEVSVDNQPAIQLYQKWGFTQIGIRQSYYTTPLGRKDAWVMSLTIEKPTPSLEPESNV